MGEREQRKRQDPSKKRPSSSREDGLPASPLHQAGWLMAEEQPAGQGEACQTDRRLPLDLVGTGNFGRVGRETKRPRRNIESVLGRAPWTREGQDEGRLGAGHREGWVWGRPQGHLLQTGAAGCHHLCPRSDVRPLGCPLWRMVSEGTRLGVRRHGPLKQPPACSGLRGRSWRRR